MQPTADDLPARTSCGGCCGGGSCDDARDEGPGWKCSQCGQSVPGGFAVCWNCGTSKDGTVDPSFHKEPLDEAGGILSATVVAEQLVDEPIPAGPRRCPRCGSS
jgi:hypothetical protein